MFSENDTHLWRNKNEQVGTCSYKKNTNQFMLDNSADLFNIDALVLQVDSLSAYLKIRSVKTGEIGNTLSETWVTVEQQERGAATGFLDVERDGGDAGSGHARLVGDGVRRTGRRIGGVE